MYLSRCVFILLFLGQMAGFCWEKLGNAKAIVPWKLEVTAPQFIAILGTMRQPERPVSWYKELTLLSVFAASPIISAVEERMQRCRGRKAEWTVVR